MSLEDWEQYVAVKRVRAWDADEQEFVECLPPGEQDLIYEMAALLNVHPVPEGHVDELHQRRTGGRGR